jgi:hypothetical protein
MQLNIIDLLKSHPLLGYILLGIVLGFYLLEKIGKNLPLLNKFWAAVLVPIAKHIKWSRLQKSAIKNDIQGKVNTVAGLISKELPKGDVKTLEIEWVKNETKEALIKENKVLVRIRPIENQDENLLNVTQPFLETILIPKSRLLIGEVQKKAVVHYSTKKIVAYDDKLLEKFHDLYYLPDSKRYKTLEDYFRKIEFTDTHGLFFSVMIRSLELTAETNRFKKTDFSAEFAQILKHLVTFIENLGKLNIPDSKDTIWRFRSSGVSYGLLLVGRPPMAKLGKKEPYLKRAEEHLKVCDYLFLVFSNQERSFGQSVARSVEQLLDANFLAQVKTSFDYRGAQLGVVRIYKRKKNHK